MPRPMGMKYLTGRIVSPEEYADGNLIRDTLNLLVLLGFCRQKDFLPSVWKYGEGVMKWIIARQGETQMVWRLHFNGGDKKYGGGGAAENISRIVDFLCENQDEELVALCHGYERLIYKLHQQAERNANA